MGAAILLAISFAIILAGALVFTNAVEWLGHRLDLGEGATGSVLAAVGTAMPETLIPIVAIIGGSEGSEDVAVGAIIGAPFLLATLAMALVGTSAFIFHRRREQGLELKADIETLDRDLVFFLGFFGAGLIAGALLPDVTHIPLAIVFAVAYLSTCGRRCAPAARSRRWRRSAASTWIAAMTTSRRRSWSSSSSRSGWRRSSAAPTCSSRR